MTPLPSPVERRATVPSAVLFSVFTAAPMMAFAIRDWLNFRPFAMTVAFYVAGMLVMGGAELFERRAPHAATGQAGPLAVVWTAVDGVLWGLLLYFLCYTAQVLWSLQAFVWTRLGIFALTWLAPAAVLSSVAVIGARRLKRTTGRWTFRYTVVDVWAMVVALSPAMILSGRVGDDLELIPILFAAQLMGIFAAKALHDARWPAPPLNRLRSACFILAGGVMGLAGVVSVVRFVVVREHGLF